MRLLSLDVGTTCCKCQLFSADGDILAYKSVEYPLQTAGGMPSVDIEGIWQRVLELLRFAAQNGGFTTVCVSSLGESFVLLDKEDNVLVPPMLYTDPRGEEEARALAAQWDAGEWFARMGVLPQSLYSVSKLLWIQRNRPELFARARKLLLIGDYIGYRLTGERAIDYGLAARTGVFDVRRLRFADDVCSALGIDGTLFSRPCPAGSVVGRLRSDLCAQLGLESAAQLVLGSHDQICAALGAGALHAGDAVDGMGTVECMTVLFDADPTSVEMGRAGYAVVPYAVKGLYATYLFGYACGSLTGWFKNEIAHDYRAQQSDFFAYMERKMRDGPTGILTLPYFAGAATPYQNIGAKGALLNLTLAATDADVYRSILEGTAMEMRLNAETAERFGIKVAQAVATGGGSRSPRWLQLKADIQNIPFRTLRSGEGGLCGCAMLQAVATGLAADLHQAAQLLVRCDGDYRPDRARHLAYEAHYLRYKKIYPIVKELY